MDISLTLQFATLFSVVVGFAGLLNTLRAQRRQANAQIFLAYTKRYDEIMEGFPQEEFEARLNSGTIPDVMTPELRRAALRYLNLCSEEYYVYRRKYLDRGVWKIWESEIRRVLCTPLYRALWPELKSEFESDNDEFIPFVEQAQQQQQP